LPGKYFNVAPKTGDYVTQAVGSSVSVEFDAFSDAPTGAFRLSVQEVTQGIFLIQAEYEGTTHYWPIVVRPP
jgi:hypothetical protein